MVEGIEVLFGFLSNLYVAIAITGILMQPVSKDKTQSAIHPYILASDGFNGL